MSLSVHFFSKHLNIAILTAPYVGISKKISEDLYTKGQWKGTVPTYEYVKNPLKRAIFRFADRRRTFIFSFIKDLPKNSRVLDWGCGTGYLLLPLRKELRFEAYGCDVAPYPLKVLATYAKEKNIKINLRQAGEYKLPYPDNFFDAIVSADVFGHVPEPLKTVKELYRILKPGGILALHSESIHYRDRYFYKKIMKILEKDPWTIDVGHINLQSHENIKNLFEKNNFAVEKYFTATQYLGFLFNGDITWGLRQIPTEKTDMSIKLLKKWHAFLATPSPSFFFRYLRLFINILLTIEERFEMRFCSTPGGSLYLKLRKV